MAINVAYNTGSTTPTVGTGFSVLNTTDPDTTDGIFQLFVDTANMVAGDSLDVQILEKARTGDTARLVFSMTVEDVQAEPLLVSPALLLGVGWTMRIRQSAGTARAFPWSIRQVA